jgi:hypothetical protein
LGARERDRLIESIALFASLSCRMTSSAAVHSKIIQAMPLV